MSKKSKYKNKSKQQKIDAIVAIDVIVVCKLTDQYLMFWKDTFCNAKIIHIKNWFTCLVITKIQEVQEIVQEIKYHLQNVK